MSGWLKMPETAHDSGEWACTVIPLTQCYHVQITFFEKLLKMGDVLGQVAIFGFDYCSMYLYNETKFFALPGFCDPEWLFSVCLCRTDGIKEKGILTEL
ncbi:hypothetical protein [uncultured Ruminobacter sp.]|uniref:hypothetical protein n=1 Tax=uncultured Ruminobacter sp. TaxID=538947 RepID=UPI0026294A73|nr:hypothetical protein [uncultured Ruminobacter sp.]